MRTPSGSPSSAAATWREPLSEQLQTYASAGRDIFPAYSEAVDRLVVRLKENGGGESAPRPRRNHTTLHATTRTGRLVTLDSLIREGPLRRDVLSRTLVSLLPIECECGDQGAGPIATLGGQIVAIMPETQKYTQRFKSESRRQFPGLALGPPLGDRDAAEDGAVAHLRQPDEREVAGEVDPAGKPRHFGDRLVLAVVQVDEAERPRTRLADPEPAGVPPWRVGHRQPAGDHLAGLHVDHDAALGLVRPPADGYIGLAQRRDVARAAVDHPQAVQVTAVGGLQRVTNGGRHRGAKLAEPSSVQRHENRVLTTQSAPPAPQAIS